MPLDINQFRAAAGGDRGFVKFGKDESSPLKTYGDSRRFGKLAAWLRNPGETKNQRLRNEFGQALQKAYGDDFADAAMQQLSADVTKPLSRREIRTFIQRGDQAKADNLLQAQAWGDVFAKRTGDNPLAAPTLMIANHAANSAGFDTALAKFNQDSATINFGMHLGLEDAIGDKVSKQIHQAIVAASDGGKVSISRAQARQITEQVIGQSGLFERKVEILDAIDSMGDLSPQQKLCAKDAVIRNDYADVESFKRSYFGVENTGQLATDLYAGKKAPEVDRTNPQLTALTTNLAGKPYDEATYDPKSYFQNVQVSGQDSRWNEYTINHDLLAHFESSLPPDRDNTKAALNLRTAAFMAKGAPSLAYSRVTTNSNKALKQNPLGQAENPVLIGQAEYYRGGFVDMVAPYKKQLSKTLGIHNENLQLVTDGRVLEVVKRNYQGNEDSNFVQWKGDSFTAIFDSLAANDGKTMLDASELFSQFGNRHVDDPAVLKESILVAEKFIHDALDYELPKYLEENADRLTAMGIEIDEEQLRSHLESKLRIASVFHVGDQTLLYTAPLGGNVKTSYGTQEYHPTALPTGESKEIRNMIGHTGFTVGPNQLMSAWTNAGNSSDIAGDPRLKDMRATFSDSAEGLASFTSTDQFLGTKIFRDFEALAIQQPGQDAPPPYVKEMVGTTAALLKGLNDAGVHAKLTEQGLEGLLQITYNRMQALMQDAVDNRGDFNVFMNDVQLIHEQLATLLAVAQPYDAGDFNTLMTESNKGMLPPGFPSNLAPKFDLKNSGMRCLASVLTGCEAMKQQATGSKQLSIAVQQESYYESGWSIHDAEKHKMHTLSGDDLDGSTSKISESLNESGTPQKLDVYVCEFHHNISATLTEYKPESVTEQVQKLFDKDMVSDQFTVAIDTTISTTDADEIKEFLDHFKDEIAAGKLNVVFYRSAQKFDMMGMDNYNAGIMTTVNKSDAFATFNTAASNDGGDKISDYNLQGMAFYQQHGQAELNNYRKAIMGTTRKMLSLHSGDNPLGFPATMFGKPENRGLSALQVAPNTDGSAVFVDFRCPYLEPGSKAASALYEKLQTLAYKRTANDPDNYHIDTRPSFGFPHSNVSLIQGMKFRFNPGLEDTETMQRYRDMFVAINDTLMDAVRDNKYEPDRTLNSIIENFSDMMQDRAERLVALKQKESSGVPLSTSEKLETARLWLQAGNENTARRIYNELKTADVQLGPETADLEQALGSPARSQPTAVLSGNFFAAARLSGDGKAVYQSLGQFYQGLVRANVADPKAALLAAVEADIRLLTPDEMRRMNVGITQGLEALGGTNTSPLDADVRELLTGIQARLGQRIARGVAPAPRNPQTVASEFFRQITVLGPDDNTIGDYERSIQNLIDSKTRGMGPMPAGKRWVQPDINTPTGRLMNAYIGVGITDAATVNKAMDKSVETAVASYLRGLPPERQVLNAALGASNVVNMLTSGGVRKLELSFKNMVEAAEGGNIEKFKSAVGEFDKAIATGRRDMQAAADMLTDPAFIASLPPEKRELFQELGSQFRLVSGEMNAVGGLYSIMSEFAAGARMNPQVMFDALRAEVDSHQD